MVLEGFSLSSMDPGGGFGGAFGGGKAGGAQDPMSFVKRPAVIARICALVSDSHCRKSLRPSTQSQFRLRRTFIKGTHNGIFRESELASDLFPIKFTVCWAFRHCFWY